MNNLEKKIEDRLTDGGKIAIVLCAGAFRFGGNWGFLKATDPAFKGQLEILKEERPQVKVVRVSNGALITCNEDFLAYNVNQIYPNAIGRPFVEMAKERKAVEKEKYLKLLKSIAEGKCSHVTKKNGYTELTLGIYCINDTNFIRIGGEDYPAYKLSVVEALDYSRYLTQQGRKVYVKAVTQDGKEIFDLVEKLALNSKGLEAIFKGLELADSDTGVFVTFRIV